MPLALPFSHRSLGQHALLGMGLCGLVGLLLFMGLKGSQRWYAEWDVPKLAEVSAHLQARRQERLEAERGAVANGVKAGGSSLWSDPSRWPERASIGVLAQAMSEQAVLNGLSLRTVSVVHGAASSQAWGRVTLEVAASGTYAGLKNWQGGLLARFPSLAVQSLRLRHSADGATGVGVDAQLDWVLYVRD